MRKAKILFSILITICLHIACSSDDDSGTQTLSNEKRITTFGFLASVNPSLPDNVTATIDETTHAITIVLPNGTDRT